MSDVKAFVTVAVMTSQDMPLGNLQKHCSSDFQT